MKVGELILEKAVDLVFGTVQKFVEQRRRAVSNDEAEKLLLDRSLREANRLQTRVEGLENLTQALLTKLIDTSSKLMYAYAAGQRTIIFVYNPYDSKSVNRFLNCVQDDLTSIYKPNMSVYYSMETYALPEAAELFTVANGHDESINDTASGHTGSSGRSAELLREMQMRIAAREGLRL